MSVCWLDRCLWLRPIGQWLLLTQKPGCRATTPSSWLPAGPPVSPRIPQQPAEKGWAGGVPLATQSTVLRHRRSDVDRQGSTTELATDVRPTGPFSSNVHTPCNGWPAATVAAVSSGLMPTDALTAAARAAEPAASHGRGRHGAPGLLPKPSHTDEALVTLPPTAN